MKKARTWAARGNRCNGAQLPAAARQWHRVAHDDFRPARDLAAWKTRIRNSWHNVRLRRIDHQQERISFGDSIRFELAVGLDGLKPEDVKVEVMVGRPSAEPRPLAAKQFELRCMRPLDNGEQLYAIEMQPELCGKIDYRFRVYPHHEMLTHPFEMGMMLWL